MHGVEMHKLHCVVIIKQQATIVLFVNQEAV
jgi:hypothetical protein